MEIFYGSDIFLINQAVQIKNIDNINIYYLDKQNFNDNIFKILSDFTANDILNIKKTIIVNDYEALLNNDLPLVKNFFSGILNYKTENQIIFKVLTNKLKINNFNFKTKFIQSFSQTQLTNYVIEFASSKNLEISHDAVGYLVKNLPSDISIFQNELNKLAQLNSKITLENVQNNISYYFGKTNNISSLFANFFSKKYFSFWSEYNNFWEKNNFDRYYIFLNFLINLEIIRNLKILKNKNLIESEICEKLQVTNKKLIFLSNYQNLSLPIINLFFVEGFKLDQKIKKGLINKNIGIDLFFFKIYDIIIELS